MPAPTAADREILPIPDRPYDGPVYEDAKDPDARFPPIEPLRPPDGRAERARRAARRRRVRGVERVRRSVQDADRRAARGATA